MFITPALLLLASLAYWASGVSWKPAPEIQNGHAERLAIKYNNLG